MKNNTSIFFIAAPLLILLAFAESASASCADHKGWVRVKTYLKTFTQAQPEIQQALQNLIASFES